MTKRQMILFYAIPIALPITAIAYYAIAHCVPAVKNAVDDYHGTIATSFAIAGAILYMIAETHQDQSEKKKWYIKITCLVTMLLPIAIAGMTSENILAKVMIVLPLAIALLYTGAGDPIITEDTHTKE